MSEVKLHQTLYGDPEAPPLVFCHGLFGQGRNWTSIAKRAARHFRVLLLDMPNHGRSAATDTFDYLEQARLVAEHLVATDERPWRLVGHSMGGKIVMLIALRYPELVDRLVVVDMSPVSYSPISDLRGFAQAMLALDLPDLGSRGEADDQLRAAVPDDTIRAFLLQNLRREGKTWTWQLNLDLLSESMGDLAAWPDVSGQFDGPTLWVKGQHSQYITEEYAAVMRHYFPATRQVTVKNAGHWVHSEQPEVFGAVVRRFLDVPDEPTPS